MRIQVSRGTFWVVCSLVLGTAAPAIAKERATLTGHTAAVVALAFSPDGKLIASAGKDHTARLWDAATQKTLASLTDEDGAETLAFSPDGKMLAVDSGNGVKLWDVPLLKTARKIGAHEGDVKSLAFSSDGKLLATGSVDRSVKVWRLPGGSALTTLHAGSSSTMLDVTSVVFSPNGKQVAAGDQSGSVRLWDLASGEEKFVEHFNREPVHSLFFSLDGTRLYAASSANHDCFVVSNAATGEVIQGLEDDTGRVTDAALSRDGKVVVIAGDKGWAQLWELQTGATLGTMAGHTGSVTAAAISPDGATIATGGEDKTIKLWSRPRPAPAAP